MFCQFLQLKQLLINVYIRLKCCLKMGTENSVDFRWKYCFSLCFNKLIIKNTHGSKQFNLHVVAIILYAFLLGGGFGEFVCANGLRDFIYPSCILNGARELPCKFNFISLQPITTTTTSWRHFCGASLSHGKWHLFCLN